MVLWPSLHKKCSNPVWPDICNNENKTICMKAIRFSLALLLLIPIISCSQIDFKKINKSIQSGLPPTQQEIVSGLKQALEIGSQNASASTSRQDGFFGNSLIKIPFPPEAAEVERKLRSMGMNKQVDEFILTMNRAAETAAKEAAPVFVNAIKGMSIEDGVKILKGSDTEATNYLKQKTSSELSNKFKPIVSSATRKVDVTRYWSPLINTYNAIPMVKKLNPDLDEYITHRALHGLFVVVGQEETKIRKDPAARVTALLKKVFGS